MLSCTEVSIDGRQAHRLQPLVLGAVQLCCLAAIELKAVGLGFMAVQFTRPQVAKGLRDSDAARWDQACSNLLIAHGTKGSQI